MIRGLWPALQTAGLLAAVSTTAVLVELHTNLRIDSGKDVRLYGRAWSSAFRYVVGLVTCDMIAASLAYVVLQPAGLWLKLIGPLGPVGTQLVRAILARTVGSAFLNGKAERGFGDRRVSRALKLVQQWRDRCVEQTAICAMVEMREFRAHRALPALTPLSWDELRRDILNFSGPPLSRRDRQRKELTRILSSKVDTEAKKIEALDTAISKLLEFPWGRRYVKSLIRTASRRDRVLTRRS